MQISRSSTSLLAIATTFTIILLAAQIPTGTCIFDGIMREVARRRALDIIRTYPDLLNEVKLQNRLPMQQQLQNQLPQQQQLQQPGFGSNSNMMQPNGQQMGNFNARRAASEAN